MVSKEDLLLDRPETVCFYHITRKASKQENMNRAIIGPQILILDGENHRMT